VHFGQPLIACDQSAITGESLAANKYMGDVIYYTTGCKRGKAFAIITRSAKHSFVGRTAELVQGTKDEGHFQGVMNAIGTALLLMAAFCVFLVVTAGFYNHVDLFSHSIDSILHRVMIVLVVAVPVGLPVVTTTTLAVGAAYLAKQKAIVQNLAAIESLAVSC
jgi:H+-transporting ATPase